MEAVHPLSGETATVYRASDRSAHDHDLSVGYAEVEAAAQSLPSDRLSLRFLTPIRIKYNGHREVFSCPAVAGAPPSP